MWADFDLTVQVSGFLKYALPLGIGPPRIKRAYVQNLFILILPHVETKYC